MYMRHENKAEWVHAMFAETGIMASSELPPSNKKIAMVVDAMAFIQNHPFKDNEFFHDYQCRILTSLVKELPQERTDVHFLSDQYDHAISRKIWKRKRSSKGVVPKSYEVKDNLNTSTFNSFTVLGDNKAAIKAYLSNSWCKLYLHVDPISLYLAGGFEVEGMAVYVSKTEVADVPELSSRQSRRGRHTCHTTQLGSHSEKGPYFSSWLHPPCVR